MNPTRTVRSSDCFSANARKHMGAGQGLAAKRLAICTSVIMNSGGSFSVFSACDLLDRAFRRMRDPIEEDCSRRADQFRAVKVA